MFWLHFVVHLFQLGSVCQSCLLLLFTCLLIRVFSNLLSLLACLHAAPNQTQTEMKVMKKQQQQQHTVINSFSLYSNFVSEPLLCVFSVLMLLSSLPGLLSLAFLLFLLLLLLLLPSPPPPPPPRCLSHPFVSRLR